MNTLTRIKKYSGFFRLVIMALFFLIPIVYIATWLFFNELPGAMQTSMVKESLVQVSIPLTLKTRVFSIFASVLPASLQCLSLALLIRLFGLYSEGKIFTAANVRYYKIFGILIIASAFIDIIYNSLLTVILTFERGPGKRMLSIGFNSDYVIEIFVGFIVIFISWIMNEGRLLQEEHNLTI